MSDAPQGAAATPLQDLLRRIPRDAIYQWTVPEPDRAAWQLSTSSAPIGRLAHEAADRLDRLASPPADQPADHIGEADEMVDPAIKRLLAAMAQGGRHWCAPVRVDDLQTALSLIARQEETIRADGVAFEVVAALWREPHPITARRNLSSAPASPLGKGVGRERAAEDRHVPPAA